MDLTSLRSNALKTFQSFKFSNKKPAIENFRTFDGLSTKAIQTQEQEIFNLDTYDKPEKSQERINARLIAAKVLEDHNLYGVSRIIAANPDQAEILREADIGDTLSNKDQVDNLIFSIKRGDLLDLMLCLDKLFRLKIEPIISADEITIKTDGENQVNGFNVNRYYYNENLSNDIQTNREIIVQKIKDQILPLILEYYGDAFTEEAEFATSMKDAEVIKENFERQVKVFLDTKYLEYEDSFEREAQAFEPHLSSILKKIDHEASYGGQVFKEALTPEEEGLILGDGGECFVIKSPTDDTKVAKIYYRGLASAVSEIQSIDKVKHLGAAAKPLAMKDNVVIETKLSGKSLETLQEEGAFKDPNFLSTMTAFIPQFFHSLNEISNFGGFPDADFNDIFFDPQHGFSFPDLSVVTKRSASFSTANIMNEFSSRIQDPTIIKEIQKQYDQYIDRLDLPNIKRIKKPK
jgi:hypothetical protein